MLCYDPLESRVGGPKVHGVPQPPDWGGLRPLGPTFSAAYANDVHEWWLVCTIHLQPFYLRVGP